MRNLFLFLCLCLATQAVATAQQIRGRCVDPSGNPVEYVSIGVVDSWYGLTSGADGSFALNVPDSLRGRQIRFAHISYNPLVTSLPRLREISADGGGYAEIMLEPALFEIAKVEVRPGKSKLSKLNSNGLFLEYGRTVFQRPLPPDNPDVQNPSDLDFGMICTLKKETWIRSMEFTVLRNTFDHIKLKAVVYRIEGDNFIPLIHEPQYFEIAKSEKEQAIKCDFTDYHLLTAGTLYIGVETVERSEEGVVEFPLYLGGRTYFRNMATGTVDKQPINVGMKIYGTKLK